jgi:hypothetical protein
MVVRNNTWIVEGRFFMAGSEVGELTISNNTVTNGALWGLLYHADVWPNTEAQPRKTRFAVEKLVLENNTGRIDGDGLGMFGEGAGGPRNAFDLPTPQHPNGHAPGAIWSGNVLTASGTGPVEPPPPPPPPPTTDPCVVDPLVVSVSQWPAANSGSRKLQFSTGSKKWASVTLTWPGTLTVTDTRGCTKTVKK